MRKTLYVMFRRSRVTFYNSELTDSGVQYNGLRMACYMEPGYWEVSGSLFGYQNPPELYLEMFRGHMVLEI